MRMAIGALIATMIAEAAKVQTMSAATSVPCIRPRDAFVRCETGLKRTNTCNQPGIVLGSTKMLLANVSGIRNRKLVVITDSGVLTTMPKMIQIQDTANANISTKPNA